MRVVPATRSAALMAQNPTKLGAAVNSRGQAIDFLEHPEYGDETPVLGLIDGVLFSTGFYDLGDMFEGSDYLPVLIEGGHVVCEFELFGEAN